MSTAERIVRAYSGDWNAGAGQGNIAGDGHSKGDRSVTVKDAPERPDGILVCTRGSGDWRGELDRFRRDGHLAPFEPQRTNSNANGASGEWRCTGTFEYDDGAGTLIYRTRRLERAGEKKRFVAERFEAGRWISGLGDIPRVPYRFTELRTALEAAAMGDRPLPPVYFVEGERKADKLADMGFIATAIAFGAKGWKPSYASLPALIDAPMIVLPDNDDPGREFAAKVKADIEAAGGKVHILELPGLPAKGDIIDWTGTADELRRLVDDVLADKPAQLLPTLDLLALSNTRAAPIQFAIERIAPLGEVTLLTGPGSAGKSLLCQQLATAAAAGMPCLGLDVQPAPAVYLTCEDDARELHWRLEHICRALGVIMASLAGRLHLISLRGELANELATFTGDGSMNPTAAYRRLVDTIKATGTKLAFLDNVAHLFAGNENDRGDVTRFVNLLNRLAAETGAAIILVGHPNKSGDEWSGSTAWPNAVRSRVYLSHDADTDMRVLSLPKANYASNRDVATFRWEDWAFKLPDAEKAAASAESSQAAGDNILFLKCLCERTRQHRAVSEKRSPSFAPTVFAAMPESKGIGKTRLEKAMDRLFRLGRIERAELWKGPDRMPVFGLRETAGNGAGNGAFNTMPGTPGTGFDTHPETAGNAANTHTIPKGIPGAPPLGSPAPGLEDDGEPDYLAGWNNASNRGA